MHIPKKKPQANLCRSALTQPENYTPPDLTLSKILGSLKNQADTGESVTKTSVMGQPSWYRAVKILADKAATASKPVYSDTDKGREKLKDHGVYRLLNQQPNNFTTDYLFFQRLVADSAYGNGYALVVRGAGYEPIELHNLDNRAIFPYFVSHNGRLLDLWYGIQTQSGIVTVPSQDMIHIRGLVLGDDQEGIDVVHAMRNNFSLGQTLTKYACIYFKNGTHVKSWLKIPQWLTTEQSDQLAESVANWRGLENSHKLLELMGGTELVPIPADNTAAQYDQSQAKSAKDKASILGVPGVLVGEMESASQYKSLHELNVGFLQHTIDPLFASIESELAMKLLSPSEREAGIYIEFDRTSIVSGNPELENALLEKQWLTGQISWEELRRKRNMPTERGDETWLMPPGATLWTDEPPQPPTEVVNLDSTGIDQGATEDNGDGPGGDSEGGTIERSEMVSHRLTENILDRLKRRFEKSGKLDLDIVRDSFQGIDTAALTDHLEQFKEEFEAVLPEQRTTILGDIWQSNELAKKILS